MAHAEAGRRGTAATFRSSMTRDQEQLLDDAIPLGRHRITWFFSGSVVFVFVG